MKYAWAFTRGIFALCVTGIAIALWSDHERVAANIRAREMPNVLAVPVPSVAIGFPDAFLEGLPFDADDGTAADDASALEIASSAPTAETSVDRIVLSGIVEGSEPAAAIEGLDSAATVILRLGKRVGQSELISVKGNVAVIARRGVRYTLEIGRVLEVPR